MSTRPDPYTAREQYALQGWRVPAALVALGLPGVIVWAVVRVGAARAVRWANQTAGDS